MAGGFICIEQNFVIEQSGTLVLPIELNLAETSRELEESTMSKCIHIDLQVIQLGGGKALLLVYVKGPCVRLFVVLVTIGGVPPEYIWIIFLQHVDMSMWVGV